MLEIAMLKSRSFIWIVLKYISTYLKLYFKLQPPHSIIFIKASLSFIAYPLPNPNALANELGNNLVVPSVAPSEMPRPLTLSSIPRACSWQKKKDPYYPSLHIDLADSSKTNLHLYSPLVNQILNSSRKIAAADRARKKIQNCKQSEDE